MPGDGSAGLVTVHALGRREIGGPLAGVPVLFHDAAGKLLARTTTDMLGVATSAVPDGASITVVEAAARRITTIAGVAPGDVLLVGDVGFWSLFPIGSATVRVPASAQGDSYVIQGPCASSGFSASTAVAMTLWDNCGIAPRPVVAQAFGPGPVNAMRGWFYGEVTLMPGGTATLEGAWAAPVPFQIALTGIPYATGFADLKPRCRPVSALSVRRAAIVLNGGVEPCAIAELGQHVVLELAVVVLPIEATLRRLATQSATNAR